MNYTLVTQICQGHGGDSPATHIPFWYEKADAFFQELVEEL
jgi:hypothetical protein